ncbi:hypothetical protein PWT90_01388 [Aphanocladium album]|nr:hypothetical protein PWT90_01388 [Aphanocladium album]
MTSPKQTTQRGIMANMRKVYGAIGFTKGYNVILWFIFSGAMFGFCLARMMFLDFHGVFCSPGGKSDNHAAPGECYWYTTYNVYRIGIKLHLYAIIPAGALACFQFVPVIRHKLILFHRINGYIAIILAVIGVVGAIMIAPVAFGGDLAIQGAVGLLAIMFVGSLSLAYYYIKRLRIDQHRAWMLRAWFYAGSIVTVRIIMIITSMIISSGDGKGGYFKPKLCRELASYLNSTELLQGYPDCASLDAWVLVKADLTADGLEHISAALDVSFGMATWMAVAIHAIGVEFYPVRAAPYLATLKEHNFDVKEFEFCSGEILPELRLHCCTIGSPTVDKNGRNTNAVLILHGTGGASSQFMQDSFAGELFGPGQLLDVAKYFIIIRDGIGHGKSSKPSDGLRAQFPKYGYRDMVKADHLLLTKHLGVNHLRLIMGTSMGGMQSWLWAGLFPDFMDAAMPLASLPAEIAGRNRMSRKMIMNAIQSDPDYKRGNYSAQPIQGLTSAMYIMLWMSSVPLQWQKEAPTRDAADAFLDQRVAKMLPSFDANDFLYQIRSSSDYDPAPLLRNIKVPLVAVNSADDQINPPELGLLEEGVKEVPLGRAVVLPISDETRGHGTHTIAKLWKHELESLLSVSAPR